MIDNNAFNLTDKELECLNDWAASIAKAMGQHNTESWGINVTFNFSNMYTEIYADCGNQETKILIRDAF